MSTRARWVTSIDELRALGPRYDEMVLSAGDAGLFYHREWLERAWPYYEARFGGTLSFLIAERGGELVALAPLALTTKSWAHARQRVLAFIGGTWDELDNWMPGVLFTTSVPIEQADIMRVFAESLAQHRDAWDLIELRLIRTPWPSLDVVRSQFPALRAAPDRLTTPRARLDAGWEPYWKSRSKRLTRILERGRKRALEDGLAVSHEVTPGVPVERRGELETIHRGRQDRIRASGRARSSPFEDPHAQRVFWSLVDWAASQGRLRTHWLRIGDRTAAYVITVNHAKTSFAYFTAIDPSAERYHPGSLLLAGMIERESKEYGATVIDMMLGANLTKSLFATEELSHTNVSVVNPRPVSRGKDIWIGGAKALARRLGLR